VPGKPTTSLMFPAAAESSTVDCVWFSGSHTGAGGSPEGFKRARRIRVRRERLSTNWLVRPPTRMSRRYAAVGAWLGRPPRRAFPEHREASRRSASRRLRFESGPVSRSAQREFRSRRPRPGSPGKREASRRVASRRLRLLPLPTVGYAAHGAFVLPLHWWRGASAAQQPRPTQSATAHERRRRGRKGQRWWRAFNARYHPTAPSLEAGRVTTGGSREAALRR